MRKVLLYLGLCGTPLGGTGNCHKKSTWYWSLTIQSLDKRLKLSNRMVWEDDSVVRGTTNINQPVIASSNQYCPMDKNATILCLQTRVNTITCLTLNIKLLEEINVRKYHSILQI